MSSWKHKRTVMRRYDLTAGMYDSRYAEEQKAKYKIAMKGLHLGCNSIILDVGCGTGLFFTYVAEKAKLVVGLDISGKLLVKAKERTKDLSDVHLIRGDADNLPFKKHSFSIVSAFTVLQNTPKPSTALKEIKRTAMPNGFIVVTGLKKAFPLTTFVQLIKETGFSLVSIIDDDFLKCYVAFGFLS